MVGAVEGEVAQGGELCLDPVEPGGVVADDGDADFGRVEAAQVAAELQELAPVLGLLDVPIPCPWPGRRRRTGAGPHVGGCRPPGAWARGRGPCACRCVRPTACRVRLEVERPELIHAEHHLWFAIVGDDLPVGDRVQVFHPRLLGRVVRIAGGLPGLYALKRDVFCAEQNAQALMADVVDHPPQRPESRPAWPGSRSKMAGHARPARPSQHPDGAPSQQAKFLDAVLEGRNDGTRDGHV